MFLKGYRVSYSVQHIWHSSTEYKYFLHEEKAQEFYKKTYTEAMKLNKNVKLEEVAYIIIEGNPYFMGPRIEVIGLTSSDQEKLEKNQII